MAKPDQVKNEELRGRIEAAFAQMREGDGSKAVRTLADAYLFLLELKPEMLTQTIEFRPGRKMSVVMRWPMLGANLKLESVRAGKPEIEFLRERFALSEAMTYYEFTLDSAVAQGV